MFTLTSKIQRMTKIIIAPDKFKGSLSGIEFCNIVNDTLKLYIKDANIIKLPLADGGDGTVDILNYYMEGDLHFKNVKDPLGRDISAKYFYSRSKKAAFIEMAEASGLKLLSRDEINPMKTSTYGTGELILDAVNKGAEQIILGIGGSATNDCGMGMARALGYCFYDNLGNELQGTGSDLTLLSQIDDSKVHPTLKNVKFQVACDVDNPLFGINGAAYIYAPQKGADAIMVQNLDKGMMNFNVVAKRYCNKDLQLIKGAGAAGGLGAGSILFLNAELKSGIELMMNISDFDSHILDADWIITGEGKLDFQTLSGKVISGIMNSIKDQKLAVICGYNEIEGNDLENYKVDYLNEIIRYAENMDDSIRNVSKYLKKAVVDFCKTISKNN